MDKHWFDKSVIYHLYPLGALDAPPNNDGVSPPADRIGALDGWLDRAVELGADTLLLGPVFESGTHGYDTKDYFHIDRRLGSDEAFEAWTKRVQARGLRLMLDGVFNHVGRDFWAFRDLLADPEGSRFADWFHIRRNEQSPYHDFFSYECWNGHYKLVKLNHGNPEVRSHLFEAVRSWIQRFGISGLRIDAADAIDKDFLGALAEHCHQLREDFWLVGEVIHGDYRLWANEKGLDSATHYEAYKSLYSSHNDGNYFEIAYSLNRCFGPGGLYRQLRLQTFVDNHDVARIFNQLKNRAHLYPLHTLLFTMPGVPTIYYGSERGLEGHKTPKTDRPLRPALDPHGKWGKEPSLEPVIQRLISLRRKTPALCQGDYEQREVASLQFAFSRITPEQHIVVAVNAAQAPASLRLNLPGGKNGELVDLLNEGQRFRVQGGQISLPLDPCWGRILDWRPEA